MQALCKHLIIRRGFELQIWVSLGRILKLIPHRLLECSPNNATDVLVTLLFTDVRTLHAPAISGYPSKISAVRSEAKWTGQRVDCKSEIPFLKRPGPLSNAENHGIRGCKEKPGKFSLSSQKGPFFSLPLF